MTSQQIIMPPRWGQPWPEALCFQVVCSILVNAIFQECRDGISSNSVQTDENLEIKCQSEWDLRKHILAVTGKKKKSIY